MSLKNLIFYKVSISDMAVNKVNHYIAILMVCSAIHSIISSN